jgi:hypothetical protein
VEAPVAAEDVLLGFVVPGGARDLSRHDEIPR